MKNGFLTIAKLWGAPLRVHWSALPAAFLLSGLRVAPLAWLLGILLIVLHEIGHGVIARRFRLKVYDMRVHAIGGECVHEAPRSPLQNAWIAWGGVLAQFALLLACAATYFLLSRSAAAASVPTFVYDALWGTGVVRNAVLIGINLIPYERLDGGKAWGLFRLMYLTRKAKGIEYRLNLLSGNAQDLAGARQKLQAAAGRGPFSKAKATGKTSSKSDTNATENLKAAQQGVAQARAADAPRAAHKGHLRLIYGDLVDDAPKGDSGDGDEKPGPPRVLH
jgi:Zn-dependent protease